MSYNNLRSDVMGLQFDRGKQFFDCRYQARVADRVSKLDCHVPIDDSGFGIPLLFVKDSSIDISAWEFRLQFYRLVVVFQGQLIPLVTEERPTPSVESPGEVWKFANHQIELSDGEVEFLHLQ